MVTDVLHQQNTTSALMCWSEAGTELCASWKQHPVHLTRRCSWLNPFCFHPPPHSTPPPPTTRLHSPCSFFPILLAPTLAVIRMQGAVWRTTHRVVINKRRWQVNFPAECYEMPVTRDGRPLSRSIWGAGRGQAPLSSWSLFKVIHRRSHSDNTLPRWDCLCFNIYFRTLSDM